MEMKSGEVARFPDGSFPSWIRNVVSKAKKAKRIGHQIAGMGSSNWQSLLCFWFVDTGSTSGDPGIFDHFGSENNCLVSEPYYREDNPDLIKRVKHIAEVFELEYRISDSEATWFPGHTTRITFWPKVVMGIPITPLMG